MLGSLFGAGRREVRAVRDPGWAAWARGDDWVATGHTAAGKRVTRDTALESLVVYGCVNLISDYVSTLPLDVLRGPAEPVTPAPLWVEQPNPETDRVAFVGQLLISLLLDGNAYVWVGKDDANRTRELQAIHPAEVWLVRNRATGRVDYFVQGEPKRVLAPNVMDGLVHVRALSWPGSPKGLSPVEQARQAVGAALASTEFAGKFWAQGSAPPGVIELDGELTAEQARSIKENWVRWNGGSNRAHLPGVLQGGMKWKPVMISPEQAQFLQSRRYTDSVIAAQWFKVDPTLLGIGVEGNSLTYQNVESRNTHLVRHTLLPWIVRLERLFTSLLPTKQYAKFNVNGLLRADLSTRYSAYQTAITTGFMTPNEARELEDMPALPGGDEPPPSPQEEPDGTGG